APSHPRPGTAYSTIRWTVRSELPDAWRSNIISEKYADSDAPSVIPQTRPSGHLTTPIYGVSINQRCRTGQHSRIARPSSPLRTKIIRPTVVLIRSPSGKHRSEAHMSDSDIGSASTGDEPRRPWTLKQKTAMVAGVGS